MASICMFICFKVAAYLARLAQQKLTYIHTYTCTYIYIHIRVRKHSAHAQARSYIKRLGRSSIYNSVDKVTAMENPQEKEFRQMVLSLSEKLTKKDTNNVVYLYELPKAYEDKEPLYVLELMQNRDLFSATKPDGLARLMKEIKQDALAKFVEKNIKKPRRKYRPTLETESDPSIRLSLQAKLEVTKIQSVITANALKQSLEMVKSTDLKRVREILKEASDVADKLCGLVKHAQGIYQCSINQPSLKGNINLYRQPVL